MRITALLILLLINALSFAEFPSGKLSDFETEVSEAIEKGKIVGCSAMLMVDGKKAYEKLWGQRDRAKSLPVEHDTIWRIYSMSKPITSVATMQLVERGKLKLDEPVATYLPEFKSLKVLEGGKRVDCVRPMTVRDLLRHTSGLTYGFFGNTDVDKEYRRNGVLLVDQNIGQTVTKLGKIPLLHQPGTRFHYSVSTDVLGRLIEVASGQSFKEYLNENIFTPLGMKDTFFTVPKDKRKRFAEMYRPDDKQGLVKANPFSSYRFVNENKFYSGGGGLCSTMDDYLRFCEALLFDGKTQDGVQVLKPATIKEMYKNQLPTKGFQFGLGFRISPRGDYSWGGAAGTRFWVDPKRKIAGVYMIQINPYRAAPYGDNFKKAVYQALDKSAK